VAARKKKTQSTEPPEAGYAPDFGSLERSLETISRSLAVIALQFSPVRRGTDTEKIHLLNALALDRHQIAGILGTTPPTVSTLLSRGLPKKPRRRSR
jgi:hypothetical protein